MVVHVFLGLIMQNVVEIMRENSLLDQIGIVGEKRLVERSMISR